MLSWEWMASFWSAPIVEANLVVFLNLLGALPAVELVNVAHARN